jgi:hypothetical protein
MRPRACEFASASGRDGVHGRQVPPQALAPSLCRRRIALLLYKRSALITVPYSCFSAKQSSSTEQACSAEQSVWIRNRASCLNPRFPSALNQCMNQVELSRPSNMRNTHFLLVRTPAPLRLAAPLLGRRFLGSRRSSRRSDTAPRLPVRPRVRWSLRPLCPGDGGTLR